MLFTVGQVNRCDAGRQGQVRQVQGSAQLDLADVHFQEVREVFRQAADGDFVRQHVQFAALVFDADTLLFVHHVQRHVHGDFVSGVNTQEVSVGQQRLERVTLQVTNNHLLFFTVDHQLDDRGEEGLVFDRLVERSFFYGDRLSAFLTAVYNGRYLLVRTTQAAARTFPQVVTNAGLQDKIRHGICLLV